MLVSAIGAEIRRYEERQHEGVAARVGVAERVYATDPADLWDALTNRERIPRWFLPVDGDLKLGGRYQLVGNAGGTITRCEPPKALDVTWEFAGATSWVNVRLRPEGERTRLILEHIVPASEVDEHWKTYGPGASGVGWDLTLVGLAQHVASGGQPVDAQVFMAWSVSDDGKVFIRESAEAWGKAHIASGEDPETARGMASRTAAFYTGG